AGLVVSLQFHRLFVIPDALQRAASVAVVVSAVTVAMNLWCGVFRGVLVALHRYDLTSSVSILQTCVRAFGYILLLRSGHGILALALWELGTSAAANLAIVVLCFRIYPRLTLVFSRPDRDTLQK